MKYTTEMDSGDMIYTLIFIKTGSGIHKLTESGYADTQQGDLISLILFFQNKESKLLNKPLRLCY